MFTVVATETLQSEAECCCPTTTDQGRLHWSRDTQFYLSQHKPQGTELPRL